MEDELKCAYCQDFYRNPVLLPCFHSLCYACALNLQHKFNTTPQPPHPAPSTVKSLNKSSSPSSLSPHSSISSASSANLNEHLCRTLSITDLGSSIVSDLDKLSVFSETDSGVAFNQSKCTTAGNNHRQNANASINSSSSSCNSRPSSYMFSPALPLYSTYLPCPVCQRMIYMDETGVDSLSKNTCLENIVERYTDGKKLSLKCQMCASEARDAVFMCEQCEIYYCEECRDECHPQRGPLVRHTWVGPRFGRDLVKRKNRIKESVCADHDTELVSLYCLLCKCSCCSLCVNESAHINHQMQPINVFCKSQKAELSQILQSLSEKAKSATEFVTKLKTLPDLIESNSVQLKTVLVNEIDEMINLLEMKKKELVEFIDIEKASKIKSSKDHIVSMSTKIQKTTGLLQFCVETLKEQDPSSFLQISEHVIDRMSTFENKFPQESNLQSAIELDFDLMLNSEAIYKEIKKLNYKQIKVPNAPSFIAEECVNDVNETRMILAWHQKQGNKNNVQGYVLELDDGTPDSSFKQVYYGVDTICQINGLAHNCVYNARVKAFNQAGFSDYSHPISISASPTLWFSLNSKTSHSDAIFSNNYMSATCMSFEDRVILGSIGFSKGVHYWEITIDRYDNQPDPSFGVARYDVANEHMLGKDSKSWCMYIDSKRSWFMHNGKHLNRIDCGIQQGCVIGILLDLNNFTLSYFVNDEPHGGIAFTKLSRGVYFPAFSLNKNVQITLNSGLEPPPCFGNSDSD